MLDEAHERTIHTDVLFGLLKELGSGGFELFLEVTDDLFFDARLVIVTVDAFQLTRKKTKQSTSRFTKLLVHKRVYVYLNGSRHFSALQIGPLFLDPFVHRIGHIHTIPVDSQVLLITGTSRSIYHSNNSNDE